MEQILPHKSLRFFPIWDNNSPLQVIGIIEMINHVLEINPNASHWLEIGSYVGESVAIYLGFPQIKKLESVDISEPHIKILQAKYKDYITSERYCTHHADANEYVKNISDQSIDVVYIDGCHEYDSVKRNIALYYPKIRSGGFLCGHDYFPNTKVLTGVYRAVNEFLSENQINNMEKFCDNSWTIRKV
jgi:predicted O-methyltransferase YrrM